MLGEKNWKKKIEEKLIKKIKLPQSCWKHCNRHPKIMARLVVPKVKALLITEVDSWALEASCEKKTK